MSYTITNGYAKIIYKDYFIFKITMSGNAALSAAKRRRGGDGTGTNVNTGTPSPRNNVNRPVQINTIQVLNQHHMKLDVLYQRQEKINKMLNITLDEDNSTDNVSVNQDSIFGRLEKLEKELEEKISKLNDMITSVQSHSINVSLDVAKLKGNKEQELTVVEDGNDVLES